MYGDSSRKINKEEERELFRVISQGREAEKKLGSEKGKMDQAEKEVYGHIIKNAEDARLKIFSANVYLVDEVYNGYLKNNTIYSIEDLRQDAAVMLLKCIDRYEYSPDCRFSTYAAKCMRGNAMDNITENTWEYIGTKKNFLKKVWEKNRFTYKFYCRHGRYPTKEEVMEGIGIGRRAYENVNRCPRKVIDFYKISKAGGINDFDLVADFVNTIDEQTDGLEDGTILHSQVKAQLYGIIEKYCSKEEQMVLDYRFGFNGVPLKNGEIAGKMGITEEEVGRITAMTILKLEEPCRKMGLDRIFQ